MLVRWCWATMIAAAVLSACQSAPKAQKPASETATPIFQQVLPNAPGKTFSSVVVEFPPGAVATPHRHGEAFVYAYVLAGEVRSQLGNEPAKTYHPGEGWSEAPGVRHSLTQNLSATRSARLLVIFIGETGAPLKIEEPQRDMK